MSMFLNNTECEISAEAVNTLALGWLFALLPLSLYFVFLWFSGAVLCWWLQYKIFETRRLPIYVYTCICVSVYLFLYLISHLFWVLCTLLNFSKCRYSPGDSMPYCSSLIKIQGFFIDQQLYFFLMPVPLKCESCVLAKINIIFKEVCLRAMELYQEINAVKSSDHPLQLFSNTILLQLFPEGFVHWGQHFQPKN